MNKQLKTIQDFIQQNQQLSQPEKEELLKSVKDADKEFSINEFKLERTEKVKRTTAILLEETIEELEQKRRAVEAQNRELEIEAALERVRAKTMSMRTSEEITDVVRTMRNELGRLNIEGLFAATIYLQQNDGTVRLWDITIADTLLVNGPKSNWDLKVRIDELHPRLFIKRIWNSTEKYFVVKQEEQDFPILVDWVKQFKKEDAEEIERTIKENNIKHTWFAGVQLEHGRMSIELQGPPPNEAETILLKIGATFDLAYKRFLDLQKAEAQAREAQIELGLERVRARSLAMHSSEEMQEVVNSVFERFKELEVALDSANILIFSEGSKDFECWTANNQYMYTNRFHVPYSDTVIMRDMIEAKERGQQLFTKSYSVEEKNQLFRYFFSDTDFKFIPESRKAQILESKQYALSIAPIKNIAIQISSYSKKSFLEEDNEILIRFAKVFDQAYTRFLDLQKAEAQARESQIQLALERIRARTMAMQHSNELQEVSNLLFQQLQALGVPVFTCGYNIWEIDDKFCTAWMSSADGLIQPSFEIPLTENSPSIRFQHSRQKGEDFYVEEMEGEVLAAHYRHLLSLPVFGELMDSFLKAGFTLPTFQINHVVNFKHGNLIFITSSPVPDSWPIFKRLTFVFEQTYTRFLDLQKAEAQAREAQIELALERVRARTMAMRQQDELFEVITLLADQLVNLGVDLGVANFSNGLSEKDWDLWLYTSKAQPGNQTRRVFCPWFDHPYFHEVKAAIGNFKKGIDLSSVVFSKADKDRFLDHVFTNTIYKDDYADLPDNIRAYLYNSPGYTWSAIILKDTWVSICKYDITPFSNEQNAILRRFANAFGQAYTRFLDLQKAEAQAKESQIQLALERVRARTMAMFKSEELADVAEVLFSQVIALGNKTDRFSINIINEPKGICEAWTTNQEGQGLKSKFTGSLDERTTFKKLYDAWKQGEKSIIIHLEGDELREWLSYVREKMGLRVNDQLFNEKRFHNVAFFSSGWFMFSYSEAASKEMLQTLERFASVFNLAYTRFLDLQTAEAQASEAKIEAALERVRSRSMGMQKSEELKEVIQLVLQQLQQLNFNIDVATFNLDYKENDDLNIWTAVPGQPYSTKLHIAYFDHPVFNRMKEAKEKGLNFFTDQYDFEEKNVFFEHFFNNLKGVPEERKQYVLNTPGYARSVVLMKSIALGIQNYQGIPFSESENAIIKRFAKVFEQTYTRFLDLQKAEAQAREAKIEAALERVRAKTMAMHKSEQLAETAKVLFEQFGFLGKIPDRMSIGIINEERKIFELWVTDQSGNQEDQVFDVSIDEPTSISKFYKAWKERKDTMIVDLTGQNFQDWMHYIKDEVGLLVDETQIKGRRVQQAAFFSRGFLLFTTHEPVADEIMQLLVRFAKVFDLTYTRFLDLQKAETQAREAQIELALERVRARTMAMHKSDELPEISSLLFQQVKELGETAIQNSIGVVNEKTGFVELSTTIHGSHVLHTLKVPIDDPYVMAKGVAAWRAKRKTLTLEFEGQELKKYNELRNSFLETKISFPEDHWIVYLSFFSKGWLSFSFNKKLSDEIVAVQKRFAAVFEQAYIRFADLQKAEAQAREATIETALEKVRSMAMAMHSSEDVNATIAVFYRELDVLGLKPRGCGVGLMHKDERVAEISTMNATETGEAVAVTGIIKMVGHPLLEGIYDGWLHQKEYHTVLRGEGIKAYYKILKPQISFPAYHGDAAQYGHFFTFKEGGVYAWTEKELKEEELNIYRRFTSVLSLTYRRYIDLKEAEKQAREATVEAGLERVRAKAMSMHSSNELAETINVFYHEMGLLKIIPRRCGVGLLNKETRVAELSTMHKTHDGSRIEVIGKLKLVGHPVLEAIYDNWLLQQEYHPVLRGNEIKEYYQLLKPQIHFPDYTSNEVQYGYFFFFPNGGVYAWTDKELGEEELKIYKKFTSVLSLTYKRYKELKESEERAQLTIRQSSLDRIRAEIASMRTTDDLQRITPSVWKELNTLGVPFFRCGVFIINENNAKVHSYLSTSDGTPLGVLHLDFTVSETTTNLVESWRQQQVYTEQWSHEQFAAWVDSMVGQGQNINARTYQGEAPAETLTLQFVPFTQGMIYVGSQHALNDAHIELVQALADAFSTAYARYEDFNKLELAKQQVDNTLKELRSTQQQLIQSEKMASLGELTAGIAHEIQNPLNFINNFSEVNKELIEELEQEAIKGNITEVKALASDLRDNEQKINHHGRRADAIVKGMLQHSRTNTGQKEPTDINALADEYLRLSYHGCRAKDKFFNTSFNTQYDDTLKKVAVVPQEIGRVFLNIFNNAFYSVSERKKVAPNGYNPKVTVVTKMVDSKIVITISDNGTGIPQQVIDKIFQPFFTTKPTGQGTGLGLSLSYDIIKAHSGELTVETKEGAGSEFIIVLPVI